MVYLIYVIGESTHTNKAHLKHFLLFSRPLADNSIDNIKGSKPRLCSANKVVMLAWLYDDCS